MSAWKFARMPKQQEPRRYQWKLGVYDEDS
jgi:hypothetical protein